MNKLLFFAAVAIGIYSPPLLFGLLYLIFISWALVLCWHEIMDNPVQAAPPWLKPEPEPPAADAPPRWQDVNSQELTAAQLGQISRQWLQHLTK